MPEFDTAPVSVVLLYMTLTKGFGFEMSPKGYVLFQVGGNIPNANRYSDFFVSSETQSFRDFIARLAVFALWREAEKRGVIEFNLLKWKNYWLIDGPKN